MRVLDERLRAPTRAARRRRARRAARRGDQTSMRTGVRERRHARAEVAARRARRARATSTGSLLRRPADALEAVRDALEPLEVAAHVLDRARRASDRRGARRASSSIQPARLESGVPSWCADSRAMPAHTRSRSARPRVRSDVDAGEQQDERDRRACSDRNDAQAAHERRVAEVDRPDGRARRSADSARRARATYARDARIRSSGPPSNGRFDRAGRAAARVGDDERHARARECCADEVEQRRRCGVGVGVVERAIARCAYMRLDRCAPRAAARATTRCVYTTYEPSSSARTNARRSPPARRGACRLSAMAGRTPRYGRSTSGTRDRAVGLLVVLEQTRR